MKPKREAEILDRFAPGWYRGLDIGRGWDKLVDDLDRTLAKIAPNYELAQVKEKFGGLRYYLSDGETKEMTELISAAEQKSLETCEKCGGGGETIVTKSGWTHTMCADCRPEGSRVT